MADKLRDIKDRNASWRLCLQMNKIGLSDEGSKKKESRTEKNLQNALGIKEGSKRKDKAEKKGGLLGSPRILKDLK